MIALLVSFLIYWDPGPAEGYIVYQDGSLAGATFDTCLTVRPEGPGVYVYNVAACRGILQSEQSAPVVGSWEICQGFADYTWDAVIDSTGIRISIVTLPSPPEAWVIGPGVFICRADYNGDGAVTLPDLAAFGMYYRAGSELADLDGNGRVDLADFAVLGELYQWRRYY